MTSNKKKVLLWSTLLISAFCIRLGTAVYWEKQIKGPDQTTHDSDVVSQTTNTNSQTRFFFGDSDSYWELGKAIAFERPYEFDKERRWQIFRTPGYPCILAPLFWFWGENPPTIVARIQGVIFGTLNVGLVAILAYLLFPFPCSKRFFLSFLSGIFVAFEPTLILQSVLILSEESFLTFALLQNILVLKIARLLGILSFPVRDARILSHDMIYIEWRKPKKIKLCYLFFISLLLGLITAATIYIRPSWYYYLPFATLILLLARYLFGNAHELNDYHYTRYEIFFSKAKLAFVIITVLLSTFLVLSPWIVRNYQLTQTFVPTSLQLGASLYDGLNPSATGASDMRFVDDFRNKEINSPSASKDVHFEKRLDNRMKQAALDWVKKNPIRAIKLGFIKAYRLWAPLPREKSFAKPFLQISLFCSFVPLFIFGILGTIRSLRNRGAAWFLIIPALYITALHSIFVSSIRYRTPALYGLSILAAYWLVAWVSARRIKDK